MAIGFKTLLSGFGGPYKIAGILFLGKLVMQLLTATPYFADLAFRIPDFVIGYLHWTFLGIISPFLFAFLSHLNLIKISKTFVYIYLCGFVLSEMLIFYKAISIWLSLSILNGYLQLLATVSCLLPTAIFLLWLQTFLSQKNRAN